MTDSEEWQTANPKSKTNRIKLNLQKDTNKGDNRNNSRNYNKRGNNSSRPFGGGWVKPTTTVQQASTSGSAVLFPPNSDTHKNNSNNKNIHDENDDADIHTSHQTTQHSTEDSIGYQDPLSQSISDFLNENHNQDEFLSKNLSKDDICTTAIASTAAVMALLQIQEPLVESDTSTEREMNHLQHQNQHQNTIQEGDAANRISEIHSTAENVNLKEKDKDEVSNFHSRCKISLTDLMSEYGDYDPDYEKMKMVSSTSKSNTTEQKNNIHSNNNPKNKTNNNNINTNMNRTNSSQIRSSPYFEQNGMLAPNGKGPIHIQIVSFGHKYNVPHQARQGWSYSNPLPVLDCRHLPRAPHYVSKLSGLSHQCKRALLNVCDNKGTTTTSTKYNNNSDNDDDSNHVRKEVDSNNESSNNKNILLNLANETCTQILSSIHESITIGEHGYANPLESTIYIGSEYGRHRSVVLVECIANQLRTILRREPGEKNLITVPVCVSTKHLHVDNNHRDEEAFGLDLRREYEVELKRRQKQEWLESKW